MLIYSLLGKYFGTQRAGYLRIPIDLYFLLIFIIILLLVGYKLWGKEFFTEGFKIKRTNKPK